MFGDFLVAIVSVLLFITILITIAYCIKKYGKNSVFFGNNIDTKNIKVIERLPLGGDRSLLIVEICGDTKLLGVSNEITLLCDIDAEKIKIAEPVNFSSILDSIKRNKNDKN